MNSQPSGSGIIITEGVWNDKPKNNKHGFVCAKGKALLI